MHPYYPYLFFFFLTNIPFFIEKKTVRLKAFKSIEKSTLPSYRFPKRGPKVHIPYFISIPLFSYAFVWLFIYNAPWNYLIFGHFNTYTVNQKKYPVAHKKGTIEIINFNNSRTNQTVTYKQLCWNPKQPNACVFNLYCWKNRSTKGTRNPLILYFGGNCEQMLLYFFNLFEYGISGKQALDDLIEKSKADVMMIEYPGRVFKDEHSKLIKSLSTNQRPCSESDYYKMVDQLFVFLKKDPSYSERPLFVWGYSLGSAAAWHILATQKISGAFIQSGFAYLPPEPKLYRLCGYFPGAFRFSMNAIEQLKKVKIPKSKSAVITLLHHKHDQVIPVSHAQLMEKHAPYFFKNLKVVFVNTWCINPHAGPIEKQEIDGFYDRYLALSNQA